MTHAANDPDVLRDEQMLGRARYTVVKSDRSDARPWLNEQPLCEALKKHHIAHVGVMHARAPFRIARTDPSGTFMMACQQGEGLVMVDGKWETLGAGQACLLPPFVKNSFRCIAGKPWSFTWVRYLESRERLPIISANTPVLGDYDHDMLTHAILGLHAECSRENTIAMTEQWSQLIHAYVMQFAQPHHYDERLVGLWIAVQKDLARPWTLEDFANIAFVSDEHLRRLCQKHLGRSPMQHLTFLRMQQARQLLRETQDKVETIAHAVGYESAFAFSNTFTKWVGWRPSEHRR